MSSSSRRSSLVSLVSLVAATLGTSVPHVARASSPARGSIDLCPVTNGGRPCDLSLVADERGGPLHDVFGPVGGLTPDDLQAAYGVPAGGGAGRTVAVWGGNNDLPTAESDLAVYRAQFGLPPCTTANGCFRKLDQSGGTSYPPPISSPEYALEQMLDLEMVSAGCPACTILLIEGDIGTSFGTVKAKGASAFSISIPITSGSDAENAVWCENTGWNDTSSGMLVTAASGDNGYPSSATWVPVACQGVVAVGGTTLTKDSSARGWSESAWSGTGSGCTVSIPKPAWQTDTGCSMRTVNDVAAVADCNSALAVYTSTGWVQACGTSAAAPLVAGVLTAVGLANGHFSPAWIWQHHAAFNDVTSGSNGSCSGPAYVCNAGPGYDGPTGWGTPNGARIASALAAGNPSDAGADAGRDGAAGPHDASAPADAAIPTADAASTPDADVPTQTNGADAADGSGGGCAMVPARPASFGWLAIAALACARRRAKSRGPRVLSRASRDPPR